MSTTTTPAPPPAQFPVAIFAPAVALTALVISATIVVAVCICAQVLRVNWRKTIGWVLAGLFVSATLRTTWWCLLFMNQSNQGQYVLNRLIWMFFSLTFLLLLFGFMESVHAKTPPPTEHFLPVVRVVLIVTAAVIVVFIVIVITLAYTLYAELPGAGAALYDANILFIAVLQLIVSLLFLIYGIAVLRKLSQTPGPKSEKAKAAIQRVLLVSSVCFVSFGLRAAMFLYRPISNAFLPLAVFYTFAYILPESAPALAQLWVIVSAGLQRRHELEARLLGPDDDIDDHVEQQSMTQLGAPLLETSEAADE